jgi:predicted acetyltransferase
MSITINKIPLSEKENLRKMIFEYQKELLHTENPGDYKYLDSYWQDEDRFPFYILVDDKIAGFVLVNNHSLFIENASNIAEFFIHEQFRKRSIGRAAAGEVFTKFQGNWEIRVLDENTAAKSFWRKTVNSFSNGEFKELKTNDDKWNGTVFTFTANTKNGR